MINEFPDDATDFEEYEITQVQLDRARGKKGIWVCDLEHGFRVEVARGAQVQPRVGQLLRVYGDIEGAPRGIFIDGKRIYLRSEQEQQEHEAKLFQEHYEEALELFNGKKEELYVREAALPEKLKEYVKEHREAGDIALEGKNWDVLELEHTLMICDYAVGLEILIPDPPSLETFYQMRTVNMMADSWRAMVDSMIRLCKAHPSPRLEWIHDFLAVLMFDVTLDFEELEEIRKLTLQLMEDREDWRIAEIENWKALREQTDQLAAQIMAQNSTILPAESQNEIHEDVKNIFPGIDPKKNKK